MEPNESDGALEPASKKTKVTDFFGKSAPASKKKEGAAPTTGRKISQSMKPASPPKPKARPKPKVDSDSEDDGFMDYDELPAPKKVAPPARAARAAPKKYVEVISDDEGEEDSIFEDD